MGIRKAPTGVDALKFVCTNLSNYGNILKGGGGHKSQESMLMEVITVLIVSSVCALFGGYNFFELYFLIELAFALHGACGNYSNDETRLR